MANPKVTELLGSIEPQTKELVDYLRRVFLSADAEISEHIKWNSPAFYYTGEMKAFDAKEYKRDLAVINLHRGKVLVVFPTGNKIDMPALGGKDYPDGRKIVEVKSLEDAKSKSDALSEGIKKWLNQIEKP